MGVVYDDINMIGIMKSNPEPWTSTRLRFDPAYPNGDRGPLTLITSNNFESGLGNVGQTHGGITRYALTNSNPHSGTQCLRLNLRDDTLADPITGLAGSGIYTCNWPDSPTTVGTVGSQTWEYWYRFDDAEWDPANPNPNFVNVKLNYFMKNYNDLATTFFIAGNLSASNGSFLAISDNGGASVSGWHNRSYGWRNAGGSPLQVMYLKPLTPFNCGADGNWHKVKIEIQYNYQGLGYSKWRLSIDGQYLFDSDGSNRNVSVDGWFNMPPEMYVNGLRMFFSEDSITNVATDRTGYACGLQLDDMSVYEGVIA